MVMTKKKFENNIVLSRNLSVLDAREAPSEFMGCVVKMVHTVCTVVYYYY